MTPAETDRLRFREMSGSDLDTMATRLRDPDVMAFYPSVKTRGEASACVSRNEDNCAEDR